MKRQRIGIYAGTFDPVHSGHMSFALQALDIANLDEVYFLVERMPRHNFGSEHYGHRVGMLRQAIQPHAGLSIMEMVDKQFSVDRTLPQLRKIFQKNQIVLLLGFDVFVQLPTWKNVKQLLKYCEFTVAVRSNVELQRVLKTIELLGIPSKSVTIMDNLRPIASSSLVRQALNKSQPTEGLLASVQKYAQREWLYVSIR